MDGMDGASAGERFPIGVAPIMEMQLSTARKVTLNARMFLRKDAILLLEGTRARCEGAYQDQKIQARKVSKLLDPLLGDKSETR